MSKLIYKGDLKTRLGLGQVRITDTAPTAGTPDLREEAPPEGIDLKMGDMSQADGEFPNSIGSFFSLKIRDPQYTFQDLFHTVFDDQRFEVELDLPEPRGARWHGYVKSTLQTRRLARKTSEGITQIKCFDGIALMGEDDTALNARARTVDEFLEDAFAIANGDLPIVFYTDLKAKTIEGDVVDFDKWLSLASNARSYEPPQPNGPSGEQEEEGLEGETARDQLDELARRLGAVAYQDVRQQAWAFVDIAAIGAPVTGQRYNGYSWSTGDRSAVRRVQLE